MIFGRQASKYYDLYSQVVINFNSTVIQATGLNPRQIFLRLMGEQVPCILLCSSLEEAKVIANIDSRLMSKIKAANNVVSIRFCFRRADKMQPLSFHVTSKIKSLHPYKKKKNPNANILGLSYTKKPPDDLITILGELLDVKANEKSRRQERIIIDERSASILGIKSQETELHAAGKKSRVILRDISFGGAKVFLLGGDKSIVGGEALLKIMVEEKQEFIDLPGTILRFEEVGERSDISAVAMKYIEEKIPLSYKIRINRLLQRRKEQ
jgi:hypothetical protein